MKKYTPAIVVVGMALLLFFAYKNSFQEHRELENNCKKTNLFVIGDKGHINRIYDCNETESMKYIEKTQNNRPN